MPGKHQVPVLQELALCSIGKYITTFGKAIIKPICNISQKDPALGLRTLQTLLESMKYDLASNVPWHLYNDMAIKVLQAITNLINETKKSYNDYEPIGVFLTEVNVVVSLIQVIVHPNLRTIEFPMWPKIMRHVLYNNLYNMSGLEVLDLGSGSAGWRTSDIEKLIINGVTNMPNLISFILCFDCTDNIIAAVGQNCIKLRTLDVTASRSVTDRSINPLLKCHHLREVKLFRTSVTINGYVDLLLGMPWLEDIGRCDDIGEILEIIDERGISDSKPYLFLRALESRNIIADYLFFLIDVCPYITSLSIMCNEKIGNLTVLAVLENLVELKLLSCNFYADGVSVLLDLTNSRITHLHLEHVDEIDRSALIYISQFCSKLKSLTFYNCDFLDHTSVQFEKLIVSPFQYLQRIKCVADCASAHLEFLLSHCTDIRFIQLGSSTGIDDTTIKRVFSHNRMTKLEELKILHSSDLSMTTVRLLMKNCKNLRRLSELESWHGISPEELAAFRKELRLVVTINLRDDEFTPGKKYYERVRTCLTKYFPQKFNVILAWDPPEERLCPSSVAAWFHNHEYDVSLCNEKFTTRIDHNLSIPTLEENCDLENLFEWIGIFSFNGDTKNGATDDYVNTYTCPTPNINIDDIVYIECTGLFTRSRITKIFDAIKNYMSEEEKPIPWASLHVHGFADSPVSWNMKEHTYFTDGDNSFTILYQSNGDYIIQKSLSSNNKPRIVQ